MKRRSETSAAELPPRLLEGASTGEGEGAGDSAAVALLRKFDRQAPQLPPEEAVWNRTLARLVREAPRQRWRLVVATTCGVLLGAVGTQAYLALRPGPAVPSPLARGSVPVASPGTARSVTATNGVASPPPVPALPASSPREVGRYDDSGGPGPRAVRAEAVPVRSRLEADRDQAATGVHPRAVRAEAVPVPSPGEAGRGFGRGAPAAVSSPGVPRIRLTNIATALPAGPSELIGEAEVILSADGTARAMTEARGATIDLDAGQMALHVEKRPPDAGRRFDVRAAGYRFTVLGTRFAVARLDGSVRLTVTEGRVGVFQGERQLAVVAAGGEWSSDTVGPEPPASPSGAAGTTLSPPPPPTTAPPPVEPPPLPPSSSIAAALPAPASVPSSAARPVPGSSCVPGVRGDVRQLLSCYLNEARGSGLTAEVALYEAARLRRDNLTDLPGALSLLREHRRRFPTGTLAYEVRLSMAEVLPKVGRYREALTDIDWLLGAQAGAERRGELLLLRGHVLRQGFENWADAERAYAQASEVRGADGRAADPAAFWRAVCLESLGRKDEARRAYAAYLARAQASLREQAVLRLRALQREHSMPGGAQKQMQPEGGL